MFRFTDTKHGVLSSKYLHSISQLFIAKLAKLGNPSPSPSLSTLPCHQIEIIIIIAEKVNGGCSACFFVAFSGCAELMFLMNQSISISVKLHHKKHLRHPCSSCPSSPPHAPIVGLSLPKSDRLTLQLAILPSDLPTPPPPTKHYTHRRVTLDLLFPLSNGSIEA